MDQGLPNAGSVPRRSCPQDTIANYLSNFGHCSFEVPSTSRLLYNGAVIGAHQRADNHQTGRGHRHLKESRFRTWVVRLVWVVIIAAAGYALWPKQPQTGHYTLDRGAIRYDGRMVAERFDGQGSLTFKNGDRYRGTFKAGRFSGQGTLTSHEGWTFSGQFKNGEPNGKGTLKRGRDTVSGHFKNGVYQGDQSDTTQN